MTYGPPAWSTAAPAPTPATGGNKRTLLAFVAGFVVAGLIAVVLGLAGVLPDSDDDGNAGATSSTEPVDLPASIGTYRRFADAPAHRQARAATVVSSQKANDAATAKALSQAHDGAGAAVQTYADDSL